MAAGASGVAVNIDDVRLQREQLRARASVLSQGLARMAYKHPSLRDEIRAIVQRADDAAAGVRLEDCVVARPQQQAEGKR